jgi:hypothetical protein
MARSDIAGLPDARNTVVVTFAGAGNVATTRGTVKRGVMYRVVSTVDCYISNESAATINAGIFLPAKEPAFFVFGAQTDTSATNGDVGLRPQVYGTAAGTCYFVPIWPVPANY